MYNSHQLLRHGPRALTPSLYCQVTIITTRWPHDPQLVVKINARLFLRKPRVFGPSNTTSLDLDSRVHLKSNNAALHLADGGPLTVKMRAGMTANTGSSPRPRVHPRQFMRYFLYRLIEITAPPLVDGYDGVKFLTNYQIAPMRQIPPGLHPGR